MNHKERIGWYMMCKVKFKQRYWCKVIHKERGKGGWMVYDVESEI